MRPIKLSSTTQESDDSNLDQDGSKELGFWKYFEAEPTRLADKLDMGVRNKESKMTLVSGLSN